MNARVFSFALLLAVPVALALAQDQGRPGSAARPVALAATASPQKSLYDRLGGAYPISVVVDDFIERLLVNDTLNANPAINEARQRVPKQGLKFHVTTLVCQVTGGPCTYTGRDMKASHLHLNISEREWQEMLADFRTTLAKFGVPAAEQGELVTIVNSTKGDIVVVPKASPK
ncbi:MAG: group I truncated hemoglobin [Gammaproteobacteria bacterium]